MDIWGFLREAAAGFVGAGLALATFGALSNTIIGHWFAKALARYTAAIETQELRKRIAIERRDREQSILIAQLMQRAAKCNSLIASPVTMHDAPAGAGPELMYVKRYGEIARELQEFAREAVAGVHLFDVNEPLIAHALSWSLAVHGRANDFLDAVTCVVADDSYWTLPFQERSRQLQVVQQRSFIADAPIGDFDKFLNRCRRYSEGPTN